MEAPRLKRQDAVMNLMKTISTNETSDARFHQRGLGRAEAMALSRNGGWFSKEKEKKAEKSHKNVINAQNFIKAPAHDMAESIFAKYRTQIESLQEQERKVSSPDTARAARPSDLVRIEVLKSLLEKGYLERSKEDVLEIWSELSAGDYFKNLSVPLDAQSEFCKNARLEQFDHLEAVLEAEGAEANKCYLVLSGSVSVETEAQGRIRILKESNAFGEEALRKNSVYPATYLVQNTPLLLIVVGKRDYDKKIGPYHTRDLDFKEKEYRSITAFMDWNPETLRNLAEETRIRRFAVGENLIQEGKESSDFMIIVKGFCEASKDVKGMPQVFGTLGLGDTLDIESVVESSPVSFTATALAIVDVMTVNIRKIVQNPKELPKESFQPLIDGNTITKLIQRERKPPTSKDSMHRLVENEDTWDMYKKQLVSSTVWDTRYKKNMGQTSFNKYVKMDTISTHDLEDVPGSAPSNLTSHISPAVLPPSIRQLIGINEPYQLSNVMMGKWLVEGDESDIRLNEKFFQIGPRVQSPEDESNSRRPQKAFENWSLPNSKVQVQIESNPVMTMAGPLGPAFKAVQSRWKQISGKDYRKPSIQRINPEDTWHLCTHTPRHKKFYTCKSAPKELLRPPDPREVKTIKIPKRKKKEEDDPDGPVENEKGPVWRPIGHYGDFAKVRGGYMPDVERILRRGEEWILKPKAPVEEEKTAVPKWVPAGTHRLSYRFEWSPESHTFERRIERQWSGVDPEDRISILSPSALPRPSTALGHREGRETSWGSWNNSSLNLSKDFGGVREKSPNQRPATAVAHLKPWNPVAGPLMKKNSPYIFSDTSRI